jgi:hypothetical protein
MTPASEVRERGTIPGKEPIMSDPHRQLRADVAGLAALIERAGTDLALAEEPSNFVVALEAGAEAEADRRE